MRLTAIRTLSDGSIRGGSGNPQSADYSPWVIAAFETRSRRSESRRAGHIQKPASSSQLLQIWVLSMSVQVDAAVSVASNEFGSCCLLAAAKFGVAICPHA